MSSKIPKRLRKFVRERASYRCEYCQSSEWLSGQICHIDHIVPRDQGGPTVAENLCLACASCNGSKLHITEGSDPETGELVPLFNPRQQAWSAHFEWSNDGTQVSGITPSGRATVALLQMNRPLAIAARTIWVSVNRHPPSR